MKCIVCGAVLDEESEDERLCIACKSLGYGDDFPEVCRAAHCDNVRYYPDCLYECKYLCEEDLEELWEKSW